MRAYPVRLEVREDKNGFRLFAVPCHNVGWAPIPMTKTPRGTPGGALAEFAGALYKLQHEDNDGEDHGRSEETTAHGLSS